MVKIMESGDTPAQAAKIRSKPAVAREKTIADESVVGGVKEKIPTKRRAGQAR